MQAYVKVLKQAGLTAKNAAIVISAMSFGDIGNDYLVNNKVDHLLRAAGIRNVSVVGYNQISVTRADCDVEYHFVGTEIHVRYDYRDKARAR